MVTALVELIISIMASLIVGYFLDALKKPYPVTHIDYWFRKNFKNQR